MEGLDVDPFFANISIEENINVRTVFENTEMVEGLPKIKFKELLSLATKESYFSLNGKLCKHVDGVAMDSPLDPTITSALLKYFERNWLQNCPSGFTSRYYHRYDDDIFVMFTRTFRSLPKLSKWLTCEHVIKN